MKFYPQKLFTTKLSRFLIVGSSTVLIDLLAYITLSGLITIRPIAKGISFALGSIYSYQMNRVWTFKSGSAYSKQIILFFVVYIFGLILNVTSNQFFINHLYFYKYQIAFIFATLLSAIFNFTLMKKLVFRPLSNR